MRTFVFLVCSERSGSNLVTSLLDGHSRICGPAPSHLFRLFGTNRGNYGNLEDDLKWETFLEDLVAGFQSKLGRWCTDTTLEELRSRVDQRSAAAALRFLYEREAADRGADIVFVKENQTYDFAPFLLAHFPGCRFVWMVRDPRDVASSWVSTPSVPGGVRRAVDVWIRDQTASRQLFHQIRDSGRAILVRYEDLVRDPRNTLRLLAEFLGLRFESTMLESFRRPLTIENAQRIEAWANLERPILQNTGNHRRVLSAADRRYVELSCFGLMDDLGYVREAVDEVPEPDATAAELAALQSVVHPGTGSANPSLEEREIRTRRLAVIDRVLARSL